MDVFIISIISTFIISVYSQSSSNNGGRSSSSGSSVIVYIFLPIVISIICCGFLCVCFKTKLGKRNRMGVLPLSTQIALTQQENEYAPPSYYQVPPYAQPPPYEQPPPYSAPAETMNVASTP
jgi:hypothetical protein